MPLPIMRFFTLTPRFDVLLTATTAKTGVDRKRMVPQTSSVDTTILLMTGSKQQKNWIEPRPVPTVWPIFRLGGITTSSLAAHRPSG